MRLVSVAAPQLLRYNITIQSATELPDMPACQTGEKVHLLCASRTILEPDCAITLTPSPLSTALNLASRAYLENGLRLLQARGTIPMISASLRTAFTAVTLPLFADILNLAEVYASIAGQSSLRLRLERITGDSCRKFHVDYVTLRLLRAYQGPGVQWKSDGSEQINTAAPGDIVFLKGRKFPNWTENLGILHRSPPLSSLSATQRVRLLLTIDTADACMCGAEHALTTIIEQ